MKKSVKKLRSKNRSTRKNQKKLYLKKNSKRINSRKQNLGKKSRKTKKGGGFDIADIHIGSRERITISENEQKQSPIIYTSPLLRKFRYGFGAPILRYIRIHPDKITWSHTDKKNQGLRGAEIDINLGTSVKYYGGIGYQTLTIKTGRKSIVLANYKKDDVSLEFMLMKVVIEILANHQDDGKIEENNPKIIDVMKLVKEDMENMEVYSEISVKVKDTWTKKLEEEKNTEN
jgi:hypothetical protein